MVKSKQSKALDFKERLSIIRKIDNQQTFDNLFRDADNLSSIKKDISKFDKATDYVDLHMHKALSSCFGGKNATSESDLNQLLDMVVETKSKLSDKARKLRDRAKPDLTMEDDVNKLTQSETIINRLVQKRYAILSALDEISKLEGLVYNISKYKKEIKSLEKQIRELEKSNTDGVNDTLIDGLRRKILDTTNHLKNIEERRFIINYHLSEVLGGDIHSFVSEYSKELVGLSSIFNNLKVGVNSNTTMSVLTINRIKYKISRLSSAVSNNLVKINSKQVEANMLREQLGIMPINVSNEINERLSNPTPISSSSTPEPTAPEAISSGSDVLSGMHRINDHYTYYKNRKGAVVILEDGGFYALTDQAGLDEFINRSTLGITPDSSMPTASVTPSAPTLTTAAVNPSTSDVYSYSIDDKGQYWVFINDGLDGVYTRAEFDRFKAMHNATMHEIVAPQPVVSNNDSNEYTYYNNHGKISILKGGEFYMNTDQAGLDKFIKEIGYPVIEIPSTKKPTYYYQIDKNGKVAIFQDDILYAVTDRKKLNEFIALHKDNIYEITSTTTKVDEPIQQASTSSQSVSQGNVNVQMMADALGISFEVASKVVGLYNAKEAGLIDEETFSMSRDAILGNTTKKENTTQKTKKSTTRKNSSKKANSKSVKDKKDEVVSASEIKGENLSQTAKVEQNEKKDEVKAEEVISSAVSSVDLEQKESSNGDLESDLVQENTNIFESSPAESTTYEKVEETLTSEVKPDPWAEGPNDYGVIGSIVEDKPDPTIPNDPRIFEEPIYNGSEVKDSASVESFTEEKTDVVEQPVAEEVKSEVKEPDIISPVTEEVISQPEAEEVKQPDVPVQEEIKEPEVVSQPDVTPAPVEPVVEQTPAFVAPVETPVKDTVEQEGPTPEIVAEVPAEFTAPINLEEELKAEQSTPVSTERPSLEPIDFARNPLSDSPSPVAEVEELINHDPSVVPDEEVQAESIEQSNVSKVEAAAPTSTAVFGGALGKVQQGIRDWLAQQDLNNPKLTDGGHNR